jgi:site-specific recombinase XerC
MTVLSPTLRLRRQLLRMADTLVSRPELGDMDLSQRVVALHEEWVASMRETSLVNARFAVAQWADMWSQLPSEVSPLGGESMKLYVKHLELLGLTPRTICAKICFVIRFLRSIGASEASVVLTKLKRRYSHSYRSLPRISRALVREEIEAMLSMVDMDDPRQVQDAAILLVLYEGPARSCEILGVREGRYWVTPPVAVQDLVLQGDNSGTLRLNTHVTSCRDSIGLSPRCGTFLRRWLELTGIQDGHLFRSFVHATLDRVSPHPVTRLTARKRLVNWAERTGLLTEGVTLESPRMGLATDLFPAAQSMDDLLIRTRWGSASSLFRALNAPARSGNCSASRVQLTPNSAGYRRKPGVGSPQQAFAF